MAQGRIIYKAERRSARSVFYDIYRYMDFGDGHPMRVSREPEASFRDCGQAYQWAAKLTTERSISSENR